MDDNSVRNMTRGGQTFLHTLRMINQVLNKVIVWIIPIGLMVSFAWFMLTTDTYSRYIGQQWGWGQFNLFFDGKQHQQIFQLQNGNQVKINSTQIIHAPFVQAALHELSDKAKRSL